MCGIVGFSGNSNSAKILKDCLGKLEYRGYDSFGIVTYKDGNFFCKKEPHLKCSISDLPWEDSFKILPGNSGIAHCRWATHGVVSEENTHPHVDFTKKIYMVHNGVVENHAKLKELLQKKNIQLSTQSDSKILLYWISSNITEYNNKQQIIKSINQSLSFVEGRYAIAIMFLDYPNTIFATKKGTSIIVAKTNIGSFVSSDIATILPYNPNILILEDEQIAVINDQDISVFYKHGDTIKNNQIVWEKPTYESHTHEKGKYPFFMIKEIEEQPSILGHIYQEFSEYKENYLNYILGIFKEKILHPDIKFLFLGCGSSWHAGLFAKYCFEELSRIKADVEYASEFRYRNPIIESNETIGLIISQSGETADSIAAMEKVFSLGMACISLVNCSFSEIARKSLINIQINAGTELGVAATKSFSAQVLLLYLLSIEMGRVRNNISNSTFQVLIEEVSKISDHVSEILKLKDLIKEFVHQFFTNKNVALYLGRGSSMCMALEGALKLKEVSYVHAHGYPAAEIKHGPIALVEKDMPIIVLVPPHELEQSKILSNINEVKSRGAKIIAICSQKDGKSINNYCDAVIEIPKCTSSPYFSILSNIALQLIAYEVAVLKKINPDRPRNLAKSVTVE